MAAVWYRARAELRGRGTSALALPVPIVATGRWLWVLLAERIGAIAEPVTLAGLNLVAAVPGRHAGALSPATALRTE
jgi:hypothetical protein